MMVILCHDMFIQTRPNTLKISIVCTNSKSSAYLGVERSEEHACGLYYNAYAAKIQLNSTHGYNTDEAAHRKRFLAGNPVSLEFCFSSGILVSADFSLQMCQQL